MNLHKHKLYM